MSNSSRRGPYKTTKRRMTDGQPSDYFTEAHEHKGHFVSWATAINRGNGQISVLYKVFGDRKQYRCPRYKSAWMDGQNLDFAKFQVETWKNENNSAYGKGDLLPPVYLSHRKEFLQFLHQNAEHTTIDGYEAALRQYVFPFFISRLKLDHPSKWTQDAVIKWEQFLTGHLPKATSRNRKRTALRRYFKFLKFKGYIKTTPQIDDEQTGRENRETPIPDDLPQWEGVLDWLQKLPPGRYRFIRTIAVAFGLRISEAVAVKESDFIGHEELEDLKSRGDFVSRLVEKGKGYLFLNVNKAEKKTIFKDIIKILGDNLDLEPKSGPYTACCTNEGIAEFILELLESNEHLMELGKDEVYKVMNEVGIDPTGFKFHLYRPHDDRRLNITLQCLDLSLDISDVIETVCFLHGQSSREVFNRYFQWGLTQRRILSRKKGSKLKIIKAV